MISPKMSIDKREMEGLDCMSKEEMDSLLNPVYELLPGGLVPRDVMNDWIVECWAGREGHCAGDEEEAMVAEVSGEHGGVYGEITPYGFRDVASWMKLHEDDVFIDMGSGVGKSVMQAWLEYGVQHSIGVELAPSRHARATRALGDIAQRHETLLLSEAGGSLAGIGASECSYTDSEGLRRVSLMQGDLLQQDLSEVSVVWLSSLCFSKEFMAQIAAKLSLEAPLLRCVVSMAPFEGGIEGLEEEEPMLVEMSWTREGAAGTPVHLYSLRSS